MNSPLIREYLVTSHILSLDDIMERLGLTEPFSTVELLANWFKRLKLKLAKMGLWEIIPENDLKAVAAGDKLISDVIEVHGLSGQVLQYELDRLNQIDRLKIKEELERIGVFDHIPKKEQRDMVVGGMFAAPILKHLKLTDAVLSFTLSLLDKVDGGRHKRLRDNPNCPFRLGSAHIPTFWNALDGTYRGVNYATEKLLVLQFPKKMGKNDALSYFGVARLLPGTIKHLLALAVDQPTALSTELTLMPSGQVGPPAPPRLGYGKPMVPLGSVVGQTVPVFSMGIAGLSLSEGFTDGAKWPEGTQFIATEKHD